MTHESERTCSHRSQEVETSDLVRVVLQVPVQNSVKSVFGQDLGEALWQLREVRPCFLKHTGGNVYM